MGQPYVGEIRLFAGNFAPAGWMTCDGQLLPISEYETLFNLIGTTYGGDGQNTFALPNLSARVPLHMGSGGGQTYTIGQNGGVPQVTLTTNQIPNHNHLVLTASANQAKSPSNAYPATATSTQTGVRTYLAQAPNSGMANQIVRPQGGSQPHDNMQPSLAITFIISLFGIFPTPT